MQPLVSAIIPAYCHERFIGPAIQSVLEQDYGNIEILVRDDCSTDATWDEIQRLAQRHPRITAVRNSHNIGGAATHLELAAAAKGKYLALISSDDRWLPHKTSSQVAFLEQNPGVAAVFGQPRFIDTEGAILHDHPFRSTFLAGNAGSRELLRQFFDSGNCLCHPASLVRKSCFDAIPDLGLARYFTSLPDLFFWVGLGQLGDLVLRDEVTTEFRVQQSGGNASARTLPNAIRDRNEFVRILMRFRTYPPERLHQVFGDVLPEGLSQVSMVLGLARHAARFLSPAHGAFALQMIERILSDPEDAATCLRETGFGAREFAEMSAWCDPLGTARNELKEIVAEQRVFQWKQAECRAAGTDEAPTPPEA